MNAVANGIPLASVKALFGGNDQGGRCLEAADYMGMADRSVARKKLVGLIARLAPDRLTRSGSVAFDRVFQASFEWLGGADEEFEFLDLIVLLKDGDANVLRSLKLLAGLKILERDVTYGEKEPQGYLVEKYADLLAFGDGLECDFKILASQLALKSVTPGLSRGKDRQFLLALRVMCERGKTKFEGALRDILEEFGHKCVSGMGPFSLAHMLVGTLGPKE